MDVNVRCERAGAGLGVIAAVAAMGPATMTASTATAMPTTLLMAADEWGCVYVWGGGVERVCWAGRERAHRPGSMIEIDGGTRRPPSSAHSFPHGYSSRRPSAGIGVATIQGLGSTCMLAAGRDLPPHPRPQSRCVPSAFYLFASLIVGARQSARPPATRWLLETKSAAGWARINPIRVEGTWESAIQHKRQRHWGRSIDVNKQPNGRSGGRRGERALFGFCASAAAFCFLFLRFCLLVCLLRLVKWARASQAGPWV